MNLIWITHLLKLHVKLQLYRIKPETNARDQDLKKFLVILLMNLICELLYCIFKNLIQHALDQLAKPTLRSGYAHTPSGSAPLPIVSS